MLATALTRLFDLTHPIILAPMGGVSGGVLAAAVSNAGGLGLVGGGYGDPEWLKRELSLASTHAKRAWGVGLITWSIESEVLDFALSFKPAAFMLSFGDPRPHVDAIRRAGCRLICQVQGLEETRLAIEAGADVIVAQGTEGGGHGGQRSTLPLVPAVIDLVAPIPVVAAGGIADGRGLAAALALGADGALVGTRFYAARESLGHDAAKARIVAGNGDNTRRTRVFDIVRDYAWPGPYTGRALRNDFMARWDGREDALAAALPAERTGFRSAATGGDFDTAMVWAGEGIDLIDSIDAAGALVARIARDAERQLRRTAALVEGGSAVDVANQAT